MKIYITFSASLLGCKILSVRFPHERTIRDMHKIDDILGTFNGYAPYLPNKYGSAYVTIKTVTIESVFTFHKEQDGLLSLFEIDYEKSYKSAGDLRRYALEDDKDYQFRMSDIESLPYDESDKFVSYRQSVDVREIVIL